VLLKPGGIMVYATCSILPCENKLQVQQFLSDFGSQFKMLSDREVFPSEGFDGFYMCALQKK
jgi:16S rRNA (cytosine967-C5)-methyltransferase